MSGFRNLFVSKGATAGASGVKALTAPSEGGNGEFITPQTLTTFAGATLVVSVISGVILRLFPSLTSLWVGAAVAFVVGLILLGINVTDPRVKEKLKTGRDWGIAILVGIINCFYLVAVVLGVFKAIATVTAGGRGRRCSITLSAAERGAEKYGIWELGKFKHTLEPRRVFAIQRRTNKRKGRLRIALRDFGEVAVAV